jgi:hypothetical protein
MPEAAATGSDEDTTRIATPGPRAGMFGSL